MPTLPPENPVPPNRRPDIVPPPDLPEPTGHPIEMPEPDDVPGQGDDEMMGDPPELGL